MSQLVEAALQATGLIDALVARRAGAMDRIDVAKLRAADLLALGALADRVRADEVGDGVRVFVEGAAPGYEAFASFPAVDAKDTMTGLELLRAVAIARITGPRGANIRVDWTWAGLEMAQVAIGFGANELAGRVATKRGLPIAQGDMSGTGKKSEMLPALLVKKRELVAWVRRAGRAPVLVLADGGVETVDESAVRAQLGADEY
jgi:2-iminoacetate synthase ThiH